ncbi:30S ribosomal protein S27e [Candidatus Pacearchaeota archaeon]|nr:30S ribosomal protein S27e [Candidatus Pacearchaeota archaeon]
MKGDIRITKSKFLKIKCPKCNFEQVMFGKATTIVKCLGCGNSLSKPSASKSKLKAKVIEVLK